MLQNVYASIMWTELKREADCSSLITDVCTELNLHDAMYMYNCSGVVLKSRAWLPSLSELQCVHATNCI